MCLEQGIGIGLLNEMYAHKFYKDIGFVLFRLGSIDGHFVRVQQQQQHLFITTANVKRQ